MNKDSLGKLEKFDLYAKMNKTKRVFQWRQLFFWAPMLYLAFHSPFVAVAVFGGASLAREASRRKGQNTATVGQAFDRIIDLIIIIVMLISIILTPVAFELLIRLLRLGAVRGGLSGSGDGLMI